MTRGRDVGMRTPKKIMDKLSDSPAAVWSLKEWYEVRFDEKVIYLDFIGVL